MRGIFFTTLHTVGAYIQRINSINNSRQLGGAGAVSIIKKQAFVCLMNAYVLLYRGDLVSMCVGDLVAS